jgi:hypothetical protein
LAILGDQLAILGNDQAIFGNELTIFGEGSGQRAEAQRRATPDAARRGLASCQMGTRPAERAGCEQTAFPPGKLQTSEPSGTESGTLDALRLPGPLTDALLAHWHQLPQAVRKAILNLLRQRPQVLPDRLSAGAVP